MKERGTQTQAKAKEGRSQGSVATIISELERQAENDRGLSAILVGQQGPLLDMLIPAARGLKAVQQVLTDEGMIAIGWTMLAKFGADFEKAGETWSDMATKKGEFNGSRFKEFYSIKQLTVYLELGRQLHSKRYTGESRQQRIEVMNIVRPAQS